MSKFSSLLAFAAMMPAAIYSAEVNKIDFATYPTLDNGYFSNVNLEAWSNGSYAFNYAPELTPYFASLVKQHYLDAAVETGTFRGGTTVVFSSLFDHVYTIEIHEPAHREAKERLKSYENVECLLGSSEKVLQNTLPKLAGQRVLFYLDAHWGEHWPLLEELDAISLTHKDNCIIVIDDFKVPGRSDIPYDSYGAAECSINYVRDHLNKIYTSYTAYYLIPLKTSSRAKLVCVPNSWSE